MTSRYVNIMLCRVQWSGNSEELPVGGDGLGLMPKGTDLYPLLENTIMEGPETPTAILGVDSMVSRRGDGGLILKPLCKRDSMGVGDAVIFFDGRGSHGVIPGFDVVFP